ncbi:type II secretion system secretin GspD [Methylomicrobium lacus]|uniref:type II secretion system secretin GspD n=1 Tax=Methylomicrobium lacus TaxID=136992 RepID=UPI0035A9984E
MGPKPAEKLKLTPVSEPVLNENSGVLFEELQNKKATEESLKSKIELYPASGRYSPRQARAGGGSGRPQAKSAGPGTYSLNFDEADLGEVSKVILSDILGQNYVLSPKVAGKVTLQTTEPLTKEELIPALEMVLRLNNAALVKEGRIYHIEPAAEAVYSAGVGQGAGNAGFQSRVIPIRYVAAADLLEVIKPLLQEKTGINVDAGRNALIVSGSSAELERIMDLVASFDIDVLRGRSFGLFTLEHVAPEDVIKELEAVFNVKGGEEGGDFFRFLPIERLNAVLAITQQQDYLRDIESWVYRLDRATSTHGGGVNVYRVQHMDAVELADELNAIFTGAAMPSKQAKVAPGQTAATITNKSSTEKTKSSQRTASTGKTGDASVSNVGENVRIIADAANNSVVIVSTPQEYEVIHKVIAQLDVMPLQVLVDAQIVSVSLTDNLEYGIRWYIEHQYAGGTAVAENRGAPLNSSTPTADVSIKSLALAAATGGFGYAFASDSGDIRALLTAEANKGKVNVISTPSLMVLNNQEASIQVGDEIPLRTSQSTNVTNVNSTTPIIGNSSTQTSGGLVTSGIQQRKTGVKLKVKPRVNANGMVIMDIEQSVERPVQTQSSQIDSPTIQTREITSNVAVLSGETIVLGGLIDDNRSVAKGGFPFLHELPLIGPLFGNTSNTQARTELVVLITPRVVKSNQDSRQIANEFKRKLTGIYEDTPTPSHGSRMN